MSQAKLFIEDWRLPVHTDGAYWRTMSPGPVMGSVSPAWANPGFQAKPRADMVTLVGMSMSMQFYNGVPSGVPGDLWYDIATAAINAGYDQFPMRLANGTIQSGRLCNYNEGPGGTATYMLNVARPDVARWLASMMDARLQWADGWHVDYWNGLGWLFTGDPTLNPGYVGVGPPDDSFWTAWMLGLNRTVHEFRRLRTARGQSTHVIGQQFKNGVDRELNARFNEESPWQYPGNNSPYATWQEYHQHEFDTFAAGSLPHGGDKSNMVVNLRYPLNWSVSDRQSVIDFCSLNQCFCAWGIESTAGLYWPG